jgi:hypothetical protein
MNRRSAFNALGVGTTLVGCVGPLAAARAVATRSMPPKIKDVKVKLTQPAEDQLVILKVLTSEPGLYGIRLHDSSLQVPSNST